MIPMKGPWPFAQWGIDLISPLTLAPGKIEHEVVAIDYFTKWVEAKPLVNITANSIIGFVQDNIVYRFRYPEYSSQARITI